MPVTINLAPTQELTISTKKVYRFILVTAHETITLRSINSTITVEK